MWLCDNIGIKPVSNGCRFCIWYSLIARNDGSNSNTTNSNDPDRNKGWIKWSVFLNVKSTSKWCLLPPTILRSHFRHFCITRVTDYPDKHFQIDRRLFWLFIIASCVTRIGRDEYCRVSIYGYKSDTASIFDWFGFFLKCTNTPRNKDGIITRGQRSEVKMGYKIKDDSLFDCSIITLMFFA